jgi:hypothetical protein
VISASSLLNFVMASFTQPLRITRRGQHRVEDVGTSESSDSFFVDCCCFFGNIGGFVVDVCVFLFLKWIFGSVVHWTLSICFLVGFLALRVGFSSCFSNNK